MVFIPIGIFRMGCDPDKARSGCQPDEAPLHSVTLDAFLIDRFEVTNAQYAECVASGACRSPLKDSSMTRPDYYNNPLYADYPVIYVTWWDATAYCIWAGKHLPSEAEWEKAARLGKIALNYPWGDAAPSCALANFYSGEANSSCTGDTVAVGSYLDGASKAGVMDLAGNVAEWVFDRYNPTYYFRSVAANPTGPSTGDERVVRGGSWLSPWGDIRTAERNGLDPNKASPYTGFRCAETP